MRKLGTRIAIVAVLSVSALSQSHSQPPMPFYDWGACPFEGCTYRQWQARESVTAWSSRDHKSSVQFKVRPGEWVQALTGVVITTKPGTSKILVPMQVGDGPSVNVRPGDILYTLHYMGEGYDLFWFHGKTYSDEISREEPDPDPPPANLSIQVRSRPQNVWWVKIKNKDGKIGWTDQTDAFENKDSLALWQSGINFTARNWKNSSREQR